MTIKSVQFVIYRTDLRDELKKFGNVQHVLPHTHGFEPHKGARKFFFWSWKYLMDPKVQKGDCIS